MKTYVLGFPFYKDMTQQFVEQATRILLLKKRKPPSHKGLLNGFGGKIEEEKKETAVEAMVREFKEETGLATEHKEWALFAVLEGKDYKVFCFMAWMEEARLTKAHNAVEACHYINVNGLPYNVVPDLRYLIPLALDRTKAVVNIYDRM